MDFIWVIVEKFDDLDTPLSIIYQKLKDDGHLMSLQPRFPPKSLPKGYDPNEHCSYLQAPGHHTDECKALDMHSRSH